LKIRKHERDWFTGTFYRDGTGRNGTGNGNRNENGMINGTGNGTGNGMGMCESRVCITISTNQFKIVDNQAQKLVHRLFDQLVNHWSSLNWFKDCSERERDHKRLTGREWTGNGNVDHSRSHHITGTGIVGWKSRSCLKSSVSYAGFLFIGSGPGFI